MIERAAKGPVMYLFPALVLTSALSVVAAEEVALLDLAAATDHLMITLSSASPSVATALRRRRGRPRKFAAPSRAITLTLPEHVLATLATIDADPSRAIVQLTKRRAPAAAKQPQAELSVFGNRAVITVKPSKALEQHTGVELLPLPDGRALICFEQATTIADLELMIYDALEHGNLPDADRDVFDAIGKILKDTRRSHNVALLNRSIIVLESGEGNSGSARTTGRRLRRKARKTPRRDS